MTQPPGIAVRGLTHVFTSREQPLETLSRIDLDVETGEFVSVIGPSGCGKTTLLKAIGGLLEPTSGSVTINGLSPLQAQRRKAIGFVFQDPALLPWRTVVQNVMLPAELNSDHSQGRKDVAELLLNAVGLEEFRGYYPHELSGGMRQRVSLARALAIDPAILLMDEPLGALDELTRNTMRYELLRIWEQSGKTVVFVTHSIPEAVLLGDRVVVMSPRPGRIVRDIPIDLPRPRTTPKRLGPAFAEYVEGIRETIYSFKRERDAAAPA